jgi:hypothetical protein
VTRTYSRRTKKPNFRERANERSETRPFATITGTSLASHSLKKLSQSSDSIRMTARGLIASSARRTLKPQSNGK